MNSTLLPGAGSIFRLPARTFSVICRHASKNNNLTPFFGTTGHKNQDGNIVRVGLNYRFW